MSFFYDLNKKLDGIRATPEVTHKQLNEGVMDTVKSVGKKVAGGINKLVGHGSDEDMIKDLQRKSGAPVTGKKPTFADKIANAKKEVDEMLGDVAAEAIKTALSPKQKKIDMNKNGKLDANDFAMLRKGAKSDMSEDQPTHFEVHYKDNQKGRTAKTKVKGSDAKQAKAAWNDWNSSNTPGRFTFVAVKPVATEMDEENAFTAHKRPSPVQPKVGSTERGHKHDIKHTATGRIVTRRVDDQGISVGGETDDEGNKKEKRTKAGRPDGTGKKIGAKGPSGKSKLMTREGDVDVTDQGEYDQEGDMAKDDIKTIVRHAQALSKVLGDDDNLPEWVQSKLAKIEGMMISIDEYMQNQSGEDEEAIAEEPKSKNQAVAARIARGVQKGTAKAKPGSASAEMAKMQPKELNKFAKGSTKGLPKKVSKKKKEEDVEESTTSAGAVATSSATTGSKGGVYGKGIYDSMNFELEQMIAESMSINMSDSTEGNKSLTVTATDDDAMKLAVMLKSAGLGGQGRELQSDHMHSHGEEACDTCGMQDCGCGDVQEAVDENAPDWPTNTEQADSNFGYSGGLNKPKTDVAGDGQTTIPNTAVHTQDEDALRRMMEMAGLAEAAKPDFLDLDDDNNKKEPMKDAADDKEEDTVEESIRRMMEIAGVKKKPVDEEKTEEGNLFTAGLEDDDVKIGDKIPGTNAIKKKDIDESIFALTNQWKAYKG